jgi:ubiquitin carboxyl-terminal hydrolase 25/28
VHTSFLATGEATITDDDELAAAYRFYQITNRSGDLDFDVLQTQLTLCQEESAEQFAKATKYFDLLKNSHKSAPVVQMAADYSKPVGLNNTRNYCYFHALLQYFYAIEPFRTTVLKFEDEFKQNVDELENADFGKLAGSLITSLQVKDGHELASHLATVFKRLQSAPGPDIIPSEAVAAEALKQPPQAPHLSESSGIDEVDANAKGSNDEEGQTPASESSDVTLVGDVILTPTSDADDMQTGADAVKSESDENGKNDHDKPAPPSHAPPPIPPRPTANNVAKDAEEQYKQQDAHEVSSIIIQRTSAAIKPTNIDEDGERHDNIRDLFYALQQDICTEDSEEHKKFAPAFNSNQFLHLHEKPKDVQEGLDIALGKSTIPSEGKEKSTTRFTVIKEAPPILQCYVHLYEIVADDPSAATSTFSQRPVEHFMELNESIYLDRYMAENQSAILPIRQESWALRDGLTELELQRKALVVEKIKTQDENTNKEEKEDVDIGDALGAIVGLLETESKEELVEIDGTSELTTTIKQLSEEDAAKVAQIEEAIPKVRAELSALPLDKIDSDEMRYRLFAIFR